MDTSQHHYFLAIYFFDNQNRGSVTYCPRVSLQVKQSSRPSSRRSECDIFLILVHNTMYYYYCERDDGDEQRCYDTNIFSSSSTTSTSRTGVLGTTTLHITYI